MAPEIDLNRFNSVQQTSVQPTSKKGSQGTPKNGSPTNASRFATQHRPFMASTSMASTSIRTDGGKTDGGRTDGRTVSGFQTDGATSSFGSQGIGVEPHIFEEEVVRLPSTPMKLTNTSPSRINSTTISRHDRHEFEPLSKSPGPPDATPSNRDREGRRRSSVRREDRRSVSRKRFDSSSSSDHHRRKHRSPSRNSPQHSKRHSERHSRHHVWDQPSSPHRGLKQVSGVVSAEADDTSDRVEATLHRLHDAVLSKRPEKTAVACQEIHQVAREMKNHRNDRKSSAPTGSSLSPNLEEVKYAEIIMLVSFAVTARKVCRQSPTKEGAKETLKAIADSGALSCLAKGLAEGIAQPETSGGRAIVSLMADASADKDTRKPIVDVFKTHTPHVVRVCRGIMKDKNQPPEMRNETATMVLNVAEDPSAREKVLHESPDILALAEQTIKETRPLLADIAVTKRKRKVYPPATDADKSPPDSRSSRVTQNSEQEPVLNRFVEVPDNEEALSPRPSTGGNLTSSLSVSNLALLAEDDGPEMNEDPSGLDDPSALETFMNDIRTLDENKSRIREIEEPGERKQATQEVAALLCRSVQVAKTRKFTDVDGHELLLNLMKRTGDDEELLGACLDAFAKGSDVDPFLRDFCLQRVGPVVDPGRAASDPNAANAYVALMTDALVRPRKRETPDLRTPESVMRMNQNLGTFLSAWKEIEHEDEEGMVEKINWLREVTLDDTAGLTLKEAYSQVINHQMTHRCLKLNKDRGLRRLFDFIFETLEVYCRTPIPDVQSFLGEEVMYGCLSFQRFIEDPENEDFLIEKGVPLLVLNGMYRQTTAQVAQHLVLTAVEYLEKGAKMPIVFGDLPSGATIASEIVARGVEEVRKCQPIEIEDLMKSRLELIQHMAYNRHVFAKTNVMDHLSDLWNDSDLYYYGVIRNCTIDDLKKLHKREKMEEKMDNIGNALTKALGRVQDQNGQTPAGLKESPLQRRRSVIGAGGGEVGSPLQRRRSLIGVIAGAVPTPARRGSQTGQPGGPLGRRGSAVGSVSGGSPLSRRASYKSPRDESVSPSAPPNRASMMQRRASMVGSPRVSRKQSIASGCSDSCSFDSQDDEWNADQIDNGPIMMPHVLKTMRKVVCGAFVAPIKKEDIPTRLVGLVVDRDSNPAFLPDVLFLIGALAAVADLKDAFGEIQAIERILDLIRRAYKHNGLHVSEVVANSCLALANLCVVHIYNTRRFNKYKGSELIVQALRKRGELNDAKGVNGASALICNLCFKNEEMKKSLGNKGACEALVQAMRDYKQSGGEAGTRCISSMFKAIGNLSLNNHNMLFFISANIHTAYSEFLEQADSELDDSTVEACFRTLANLAIEKDNMEKFEASVVPVLSIIRKIQKTSAPELYRWAFEAIGNLCRHSENAKVFTTNEGIQTTLSLLPFLPESSSLHSSAIFVLGIQTSNQDNIPILIAAGILEFSKSILDNFKKNVSDYESAGGDMHSGEAIKDGPPLPNTQLCIAALRCMRRVLTTKTNVDRCLEVGCLKSVTGVFTCAWMKSMVAYEALRIIFIMIAFYSGKELPTPPTPPPSNPRLTTRASMVGGFQSRATKLTNAAVALRQGSMLAQPGESETETKRSYPTYNLYGDEDEPRDRVPIGERPWEFMSLSDEDINELIRTVRNVLADQKVSRNLRLYRLGMGLLGYFACEKKGFAALFERLVKDDDVVEEPVQKWDKQRRKSLQMMAPPVENKADVKGENKGSESPTKGLKKRNSIINMFRKNSSKEHNDFEDSLFGTERPRDKTSIVDLVYHAIDTFAIDKMLVQESLILLNHMVLCAVGVDDLEAVADQTFYKALKAIAYNEDAILEAAKEALKLYKTMLDKGYQVVAEDMQPYYSLIDLEFPLDLSGWRDDPYPDGVQSLTIDIKDFLREGGKLDVYTVSNAAGQKKFDRLEFLWKSTHDMLSLQWKICAPKDKVDPDPKYPFSVPISSVQGILPGVSSALFAEIAKKLSLAESTCISLVGPKLADFPTGLSLHLRAKNQKERDTLVHVFTVWRDAAAYGFR